MSRVSLENMQFGVFSSILWLHVILEQKMAQLVHFRLNFSRRPYLLSMEGLKLKLEVFPGFVLAENGVCRIFQGLEREDGYCYITLRVPEEGGLVRKTSATVQRVAIMVGLGVYDLPPSSLDASHLCHNKKCINISHINMEPRQVNVRRKACIGEGRCLGHGEEPECLLHLR